MSKRYELLKDLPDSKVGDVYIWNNSQKAYYKDGNVLDSYWKVDSVENNPSWFKEVVEMEWEIVKRKDVHSGQLHKPNSNCGEQFCAIHSIKRLSDGEVFSIGDEIQHGVMPIGGVAQIGKGIITRFEISKGTAFAEGKPRNWRFPLFNLHKSPPTPPTTLQDQDKFQWNDKLVKEVVYWICRGLISQDRASDEVDTFKSIKSKAIESIINS